MRVGRFRRRGGDLADAKAEETAFSETQIKISLVTRYPSYYGEDKPELYHPKTVKAVLGYKPSDLEICPELRYAVAGPAWMRNDQKLWIVHVWGVNLEDEFTADYARYINADTGRLKRKIYRTTVRRMVTMMLEGALASEYPGEIIVNVPLIGLGAYLTALNNPKDQAFARKVFFLELIDHMHLLRFQHQLSLRVAIHDDFTSSETQKLSTMPKVWVEQKGDLFHLPLSSDSGLSTQVFHSVGFGKNTKYKVKPPHKRGHSQVPPLQCVVNAWDSRSWIGNGGSKDHTIDGMLISGAGAATKLPNTSYLHNPFFTPTLLQPDHWLYVSDY
jgi:hypothetical protein